VVAVVSPTVTVVVEEKIEVVPEIVTAEPSCTQVPEIVSE
jgi:hypothetical protein